MDTVDYVEATPYKPVTARNGSSVRGERDSRGAPDRHEGVGRYLDEKVNYPGFKRVDNLLVVGVGYGTADAKALLADSGKDTCGVSLNNQDAFGKKYDLALSSNRTGDKIRNVAQCVTDYLGIPLHGPSDQYKGLEKVFASTATFHSQGCITFMNWANEGIFKAETVILQAPPGGSGPGYMGRVMEACGKAGVSRLIIQQNVDDPITTTPLPALRFTAPHDRKDTLAIGVEGSFGPGGAAGRVKVYSFRDHTGPGQDTSWEKGGVHYVDRFNMPGSGHSGYKPNLQSIATQYPALGLQDQMPGGKRPNIPAWKEHQGLRLEQLVAHREIPPVRSPDVDSGRFNRDGAGTNRVNIGAMPAMQGQDALRLRQPEPNPAQKFLGTPPAALSLSAYSEMRQAEMRQAEMMRQNELSQRVSPSQEGWRTNEWQRPPSSSPDLTRQDRFQLETPRPSTFQPSYSHDQWKAASTLRIEPPAFVPMPPSPPPVPLPSYNLNRR